MTAMIGVPPEPGREALIGPAARFAALGDRWFRNCQVRYAETPGFAYLTGNWLGTPEVVTVLVWTAGLVTREVGV